MKLVLDLLGPPRLLGARRRCELRAGSLAIGRSPEADWVIPDSDRMISRLHLRIDAVNGDFVLTDTSSNGVFVNGSGEAVGYGACVTLRDGDRLLVGDAQIAVTIEAGAAKGAGPATPFALDADAFAAQLVPPPAPREAPGAVLGEVLGGPFGGAPAPGPAPAPAPAAASRHNVIDANWMNEPLTPDASPARPERGRPVVLPLRAGPQPGAAGPAPASVLALAEARPDLTARRLAAAVDAAGQVLDPAAWQAFHEKIKSLVQDISN